MCKLIGNNAAACLRNGRRKCRSMPVRNVDCAVTGTIPKAAVASGGIDFITIACLFVLRFLKCMQPALFHKLLCATVRLAALKSIVSPYHATLADF